MLPIPIREGDCCLSLGEDNNSCVGTEQKMIVVNLAEDAKRRDECREKACRDKRRKAEEERMKWEHKWKEDFSTLLKKGIAFKFVFWTIILFIAAYISTNFISLIKLFVEGNGLVRVVIGFVIVLLFSMICFCTYYALRLLRELPKFKTVQEGAKDDESRRILYDYIKEFPSEENFTGAYANGVCFSDSVQRLKELDLEDKGYRGIEREFKNFQNRQEEIALDIVKKCAIATGLKTAASPWKSADVLIVFINATLMTCAIARVYNRRFDKHQALRYVIKWLGVLYVAGQGEEIKEKVADAVSENLEVGSNVLTAVLGKFVGKAAEGGLIGLLVYRLGKMAIKEFALMELK